jgi:hypothetical protein
MKRHIVFLSLASFLFIFAAQLQAGQQLRGHIPAMATSLKPLRRLEGTNQLSMAISLPVRNQNLLAQLAKDVSDPDSPKYRQYITADEFARQFGPTVADYNAVAAYALSNGWEISGTHSNRLLLDVKGTASSVERAMHVRFQVYQHPSENRTFYAPDVEPSPDLAVPVLHIDGLETCSKAKPHLTLIQPVQNAQANAGSGPGGEFMGKDFPAAYAPGTTLTGNGQVVGLLQFDGYTTSDITYYETKAGLPNVPLTNVLIDSASGHPSGNGGEVEVSLDIEMAISMAPGLSGVLVYEAPNTSGTTVWHDMLNRMATDNRAKQISCSWYINNGAPDPASEQIFQEMGVQGQTFCAASGDYDAYTGLIPFPGDSTNITEVGGTLLSTTAPGGAWSSETTWNRNNGIGTGGGVSTTYAIPPWQTNISMAANKGSTVRRNTPDVAMTADNVYVRADGRDYDVGGTSCASPLWAGFLALVNQDAVMNGRPTVGFINPALDAIGSSASYSACFHDITTGNNFSPSSPTKFPAVAGYDLCTGWGTPAGLNLITALAVPDPLGVQPPAGFTSAGGSGGPFTVTSQGFVLTNSGTNTFSWTLVSTSSWLAISPSGGTLPPGGTDSTPVVSLTNAAYALPIGTYTATVAFSNITTGVALTRQFTLQIVPSVPPTIVTGPASQFIAVGSNTSFSVTAGGTPPLNYQWSLNATNLPAATNSALPLASVDFPNAGTYTVTVTNTHGSTNASATLTVGYSPTITGQPQDMELVQGSNALFTVTAGGTGPLSYQWYFYGVTLPQATNSMLLISNVQATNSGQYSVVVSSPFGATASSNASLAVDVFPIIVTQPQNQNVAVGGTATFAVSATGVSAILPPVGSGTLQLWLKADTGVVTNAAGLVSAWQDQSGNSNNAAQSNTNLQPLLALATGIPGAPAVRFNGIQDNNVSGSYLHGAGAVGVPNAMTTFTVYNAFSATNNENVLWAIGTPGQYAINRIDLITAGLMRFSFWSIDYSAPFAVPTNAYRIRTDRLDTNLDTLEMFDATANTATNFSIAVSGAQTPGAGYYLGGLDSSQPFVGSSRNFNGEIAELIVFQGYLSEPDRHAVASYLAQKYFQVTAVGGISYQWQFDGTNITGATNATLSISNAQSTNVGTYSVIVSNLVGVTISSNALLAVGIAPTINGQPLSEEVAQGTNAALTVSANGTAPLSFQWYLDGQPVLQATNSSLSFGSVQATNAGTYSVFVSNAFGSVLSSNAVLTVDLLPVILNQPQNQAAIVGSNVTFSVGVGGSGGPLPPVASGTLQLWLKADAGVVTNSSGLVSLWQDQSGNSNNAAQVNTNLQPSLVAVPALFGHPVVRFNGIQDNNVHGSYMHGTGSVGIPNAMTTFTVYNAISATNNENTLWAIGTPGQYAINRIDTITAGLMHFSFWSIDYDAPFTVPTNTYRIRTDRLDTNLDTLQMFDATATSATNFSIAVSGAQTPGAGYYLGGLDSSQQFVGSSRNFDGDIAEMICYQGYLTEPDRVAVTTYLEEKYLVPVVSGAVYYQWQFDGTNIANATNSSLTLANVQLTNAGTYSVTVTNSIGAVVSSNAVLTVGTPPTFASQPQNQELESGTFMPLCRI